MEFLQFIFFVVRLLTTLAWSSFTTIRYYTWQIVAVISGLALAIGGGVGQWLMHTQPLSSAQVDYLNQPDFSHFQALVRVLHAQDTQSAKDLVGVIDRAWSPDQKEKLQKILSDKAYLEEERAFWLQQLPQQPTHRAVLWNLHLLESALGNKTQASVYEKQARQVDPNFVFPAK